MKKKLVVIFICIFLIISLFILYARFIGTKGLKIKEYKIVNEKIIDEYHGLKVVHISDIHYATTIFEKQLNNLVEKINELKPDIVVLTGDLFDKDNSYDKDILIKYLSNINASLGKYAISGNHDLPVEDFYYIIENSGFINLDNDYDLVYKNTNQPIIISGVSSNFFDSSNIGAKTEKFDNYINNISLDEIKPIYSILLMHEPDFIDELNIDSYDLILSGHSHGGQVRLPIIGKIHTPYGSKKYYEEYYKINNSDLYISSGIGTSWLKLRFFDKPSFNFYRITNK